MEIRTLRRLLWATAGLGAALCASAWALHLTHPVPSATAADSNVTDASATNPELGPGASPTLPPGDLAGIDTLRLQRPLFDAPVVAQPARPKPPPPPLNLRLAGTVTEPGRSRAILITGSGQTEIHSAGATVDGAELVSIADGEVKVSYHGRTLTLSAEDAQAP